ncbi:MAG: hypothetical protein IPG71_06300 [bacterium]|nr:hypothetical protein [bacterium]
MFGGLAKASHRGDVIEPLVGSSCGWFVLLVPEFGVETASIFAEYSVRLTEVERNVIFRPLQLGERIEVYAPFCTCNDLENIVFRRYPVLQELRNSLLGRGASVALLSGSGSTVFGIFESETAACEAAHTLSTDHSVRVKVCRAVSRPRL